jgi:sugar lactone lactonase YvrE
MRAGRLVLVAMLLTAAACTLLEGLNPVPTLVEGGAADAGPDRALPLLPTILATGQDNPLSVTVALPNIYWVDNVLDGSVMRLTLSEGGEPVVLAGQQTSPFSLVLDPPFLYFSREDMDIPVAGIPLDGGTLINTGGGVNASARWITNDQMGHLYWSNVEAGSVFKYTPGDAGPNSIVTGLSSPSQIAADSQGLYWVDEGSSKVVKAGLDGSNLETLADSGSGATHLTIDRSNVYWTATAAGEVWSVPKAGGASKSIAKGEASPAGIAVDSTHVYWANATDGRIRRAPIEGGPAVTLADAQKAPMSIAVAGGVVYWTNLGDGTVREIKP